MPSSGGDNSPNIKSAIQEQQDLNLNNPALQEGKDANGHKVTHCNSAVQDVMATVESALDNSVPIVVEGRANQMANDLATNPNYTSVSEAGAAKNAQNGGLSIVTYTNPDPDSSGHVATFSVGDNLKKGEIANIGPKKYTGYKTLNQSISSDKQKKYYVLNLLQTVTVPASK